MNITVIGLGYVGLTTGLGMTKLGHLVYGIEINTLRVEQLKQGKLPFYEEGLEKVLKESINTTFFPSSDLTNAFNQSTIILVCVDTPSADDGSINLTYITIVAEQLANLIKITEDYKLIVIKSTVIPGTTQTIGEKIAAASGKSLGNDFYIAMVPEFLREGSAFKDFTLPDRIILGIQNN